MRTAIIAGVDAPPSLNVGEQVFDQMTLCGGRLVVAILHFAVGHERDAGSDPTARNQSLS